jgi:hypothetical protein
MELTFEEKRGAQRRPLILDAQYNLGGSLCQCQIIDISSIGIGMRVKGILVAGDKIDIVLDKNNISATVVRVDGNIVGVKYEKLPDEILDYIINLKTFKNLL